MLILVALFAAAPAQGATTHKLIGSFDAGGTLDQPGPVAIDTANGSVYVVTGGSTFAGEKVEKFDASGNPVNFSFLGGNSFQPCEFFGCVKGIAVDNFSGSPNRGVIYVATTQGNIFVYLANGQLAASYRASHIINEGFPSDGNYCGVAVDGSGSLYIEHENGFFEDGAYTDKFRPGKWKVNSSPPQVWPVAGVFEQPEDGGTCKVSSDANQYLYTARGGYVESGTLKRWPMSAINLVAPPSKTIDTGVTAFYADHATADVYADKGTQVTRFDSNGDPIEVFGEGDLTESTGVAVNSSTSTVYASDRGGNDVKIYGAVTTPDITAVDATTGQHTATLSAHIAPAGTPTVTNCEVEYGTDTSYGSSAPCSGTLPYSTGTDITADIAGLPVETLFHYRVLATNANGTTRSIDRTFMTHAVSDVQALPPTNVTRTGATLNGSYSGNGDPTTYRFEWGTDTFYGNTTPESSPSSAMGPVSASATLSDLDVYREDSPPYHFRLVATNSEGTTFGPDMTFNTLPPNPPTIANQAASDVAPGSAVLSAEVTPGLGDTTYVFEYGPTPLYGQTTLPSASIGDDDTPHPVSNSLSGLVPGTTYHFRVVAANFGGTSHGPDQTFNTPAPPVVDRASASDVTQTGATLRAAVRAGFLTTTYHFEYGTGTSYGNATAAGTIGGDNTEQTVIAVVGGLSPGTTYHVRAVASNPIGSSVGADQTFTTQPAPVIATPVPKRRSKRCKKRFVKRKGRCVRKKKHRRRHGQRGHRNG